ncbi:MAG: phosphopantothenoylcysteine decarboxylase [Candidatus Omnitrophica bacterium]|nr:phosphopantothenoylcysteine decarboxylase [Candidatus Omnitrophota bacterium]
MATKLRGKRVLITAGPTWVPIDAVRVISNTASGATGILLAKKLASQGARVTLMLGPVQAGCKNKAVKVINFKFFNQLRSWLKSELRKKHYDIIIHSAAVADYAPGSLGKRRKISSGLKVLSLKLKTTPKLIDSLRRISPRSFLVGFKFEPDLKGVQLIRKARSLIKRAGLDLAVANSSSAKGYVAYLVGKQKHYGPFFSKERMLKNLVRLI